MKKVLALLAMAAMASASMASVTYNDTVGDNFDNPPDGPYDHMDITSVVVSHDATNVYFNVTVRGNAESRSWAKFCIGIDTGAVGGSSGNAWGRNINWGAGQGIDYWIGSWNDNGGPFVFGSSGVDIMTGGPGGGAVSGTSTLTTQNFVVSRASLGLIGDQTFRFDVITTGGGADPGVDHLSNPNQSSPGWSTTSQAGQFLSYTIPTPGALALVGLGGLVAARRRRA
jgi:hypothetical protein